MKSHVRNEQPSKAKKFLSKSPTKSLSDRKLKAKDNEQSKIDEEYDKFLEEWEQDSKFSIHA
jgi:hypothetical protein